MTLALNYHPLNLSLKHTRTYFVALALIAGNLLLPQLCHFLPVQNAGPVLLPIYFLTLIGAYKYGLKVGLLTAVLSPVFSTLAFGMPAMAMLPVILIKSVLLACFAAYIAATSQKLSLLHLAAVVVGYQLVGGLAEWAITGSFQAAIGDIVTGWPGLLLQITFGYIVLRLLEKK